MPCNYLNIHADSLNQTSSEVQSLDVDYPSPDDFHAVKIEVRDEDGSNISVNFYLDDELVTTQYGAEYVGEPLYL